MNHERAARLRSEGATYAEIAERLRISRTTAYSWLNPDARDASRLRSLEAKRRRRKPCVRCGALKHYARGTEELCAGCLCGDKHEQAQKRVIAAIREWHERHGVTPSAADWRKPNGSPAVSNVRALFGSWNAAILKAGFEPRPTGVHRDAGRGAP